MSRVTDIAGRAGWSLLIAFLVVPAVWPLLSLLASATELAAVVVPNWLLLVPSLIVGVIVEEAYDGPEELLLPTALLTVSLFVGFQWLVGLWGQNVISLQLLAATVFVYLAAVSCAIAIVFETDLRQRIVSHYDGPDAATGE